MAKYPFIAQSALFADNPAGSVFVPEERVFKNTTGYYLRVHRLALHARELGASSGKRNSLIDAMRPQWAIRFGHTNVTNGFVPLAATTWRASVAEPIAAVDFSKPVYLAPNDRLDLRFKPVVTGGGANNLFLSAYFEPVDRPEAIYVPALFGFEGAARGSNSGEFSEDVPVSTLYNEFEETMFVERVIGRLGLLAGNEGEDRTYPSCAQVLVDLSLQDGAKITRDPTPMGALFDLARQSWLMNVTLPAKGYIQANFSGNLTSTAAAKTYYPYIGMLGYRTIG